MLNKKIKIIAFLFLSMQIYGITLAETGGVDIHGFISQGYLKTTTDNEFIEGSDDGTFQFNEMGINFKANIEKHFSIGTQFMARDLGHLGNDEIYVDWAVANYQYKNYLNLMAGIMRVQHGLFNSSRDVDAVRTCILLPQSVYFEKYRDISDKMKGAAIYGNLPHGVSYYLAYGTTDVDVETSEWVKTAGSLLNSELKKISPLLSIAIEDITLSNVKNGNFIWFTPIPGLKLSATYFGTDIKVLARLNQAAVAEVEIKNVFVSVSSVEYYRGESFFSYEYYYGKTSDSFFNFKYELITSGGYLSFTHRLNDLLELGVYYSELYVNKDDQNGWRYKTGNRHLAFEKDTCLSTRFDLNSNTILKLEGHYVYGTANVTYSDKEDPDALSSDYFILLAKLTYFF